ncbi:hypothetical protein FNO01nite_28780 [Flavobacterium noncentrifugens]|nr:hypothetical protein FNO01nite_28780 [Flavobacterium noncentrifugens]
MLSIAASAFAQPGTIDTTYGINGKVSNNLGGNAGANDSVLQPDGKLVTVGQTYSIAPGSSFLIARYLTDGNLDASFGTNGSVSVLGGDHCMAESVALQADGKIVVVGTALPAQNSNLSSNMMIVRYNTDGTLDNTFDGDGIKIIELDYSQSLNAVLIQEDGKIIAGGLFTILSNPNMDTPGLIRFNSDGSLDTTFGVDGYVYTAGIYRGEITDMQFTDNGAIIAVGRTFIISKYLIIKYDSNGQLINSFGSDGTGFVEVALNQIADLFNCAIGTDGSIYASGGTFNGTKYNAFMVKYHSDGTIDPTFANNGTLIKDFGNVNGVPITSFAYGIAFDKNNQLILALTYGKPTDYDFGLQSYSKEGILNTSFGTNGLFSTTFGSGHEYVRTMVIQEDNKIILAGDKGEQVLVRVNNDPLLSTNEAVANDNKMYVSPNPITENSALFFELQKQSVITVDLFDAKGLMIRKLLSNQNFPKGQNIEKNTVLQFNLQQGIYFLKIYVDNKYLKTLKIVK